MKFVLTLILMVLCPALFGQSLTNATLAQNYPSVSLVVTNADALQLKAGTLNGVQINVGDLTIGNVWIQDYILRLIGAANSTNVSASNQVRVALQSLLGTNAVGGVGFTNGAASAQSLSVADSFLAVQTTNVVVVTNAGTDIAKGTYLISGTFAGFANYTNQGGIKITNSGSLWIIYQTGVGSLYSSATLINQAWTQVSGNTPVPVSRYGMDIYMNGDLWGAILSTNLSDRLARSSNDATSFSFSQMTNTVSITSNGLAVLATNIFNNATNATFKNWATTNNEANSRAIVTNIALSLSTVPGPFVVQSPASIYGSSGNRIGINTNKGPSWDDFNSVFRYFPDSSGYGFYDTDNSTLIASLGSRVSPFNEQIFRGYKSTQIAGPNQGESIGAIASIYAPFQGGSGASLHDLPTHGRDIWNNQTQPWFAIVSSAPSQTAAQLVTNASWSGLSNAISQAASIGVSQYFSNHNAEIGFWFDQGWSHTNRNANGTLAWSTNQFPGAQTLPWSIAYAHSNGWSVYLANYITTTEVYPPNNQVLIDVNGGTEYLYPSNQSYGTTYVAPESTMETVPTDAVTLYGWNIDGWIHQDQGGFVGSYGLVEDISRRTAGAQLYPGTSKLIWNQAYTNYTHAMRSYIYTGNFPQPSYVYEANGMMLDSVSPIRGTNGTEYGMGFAKPFQSYLVQAPDKSCLPTFVANSTAANGWNTNDWQGFLGACAMWRANIGVCQQIPPIGAYVLTNAGFQELWQDGAGKWPITISSNVTIYATNGVFRRDVSDPNVRWVFFENEGLAPVTLTATWAKLGINTNTVVSVKRMVEGDEIANVTNLLTYVVGAQSNMLVKLTILPNYLTNNYVQSITATNFTTLTASGNVGSLRIGGQLGGLATVPTITSYSGGNGQMIVYGGEDGIQFNNWQASSNIMRVNNGGTVEFQNPGGFVTNAGTTGLGGNITASGSSNLFGGDVRIAGKLFASISSKSLTNFVNGQYYTNVSGRTIRVQANAQLTTASIVGTSGFVLFSDDAGGHTFITNDTATIDTVIGSIGMTYHQMFGGEVTNGGCYYFTNVSSGVGDAAGLSDKSGRIITY